MSRIDQLLSALLNGETVDITPQSRAEVYLKALIDGAGTEGLPAPQSRLDAYFYALVEKGIGGSGGGSTDQTALAGAYTADGTFSTKEYTWDEMVANGDISDAWSNQPCFIDDKVEETELYADMYDIVVPDTVTYAGYFYCKNIVLPKTTTRVGGTDSSIGKVYVKATTPPALHEWAFFEIADVIIRTDDGNGGYYEDQGGHGGTLGGIVVPIGCGNIYRNWTNWSLYAAYIEEGEMPI